MSFISECFDEELNIDTLDKWYTKSLISIYCVGEIQYLMNSKSIFIEPSAGNGSFIDALKKYNNKILAFDILPERDDIKKLNWFFNDLEYNENNIVIGNPPFGKKGKLAAEFINKSSLIADYVCFIVPYTLGNSYTAQKKVDSRLKLIKQIELPENSFEVKNCSKKMKCYFQIWARNSDIDLRLKKPETEHEDLEIRIYNKTKQAEKWLAWDWDIAIKRNSKLGIYSTDHKEVTNEYHWILIKGPIDKLKRIDWSKLNDNKITAGMGKADIIKAYNLLKDKEKIEKI